MKPMSREEKQDTEEMDEEPTKFLPADSQAELAKPSEGENTLRKLVKWNNVTLAGEIGIALMTPGVLALIFSVVSDSQVLAFVGLGLTFWGALFFLVQPKKLVQGSLLDATAAASYSTIDQIISDLKYTQARCWYIPPYPKRAYLPEHLKGLKEMMVFISAREGTGLPSLEEIANKKFMLQNPEGIDMTAPGAGLLDQIENELKLDPTQTNLQTLCETLPQQILENFQLAKEIEMKPENDSVSLKITGSIFRSLYLEKNLKSVHLLGCPLVSALACAIAKTTGKAVTINTLGFDAETDTTQASCNTKQKTPVQTINLQQKAKTPKPQKRKRKRTPPRKRKGEDRWRAGARKRGTQRWRKRTGRVKKE
jgi:hypothetical protein